MKLTYKHTLSACCTAYTVQAAINNFSPLLYAFFAERLGISLTEISLLITVNFLIQIGMDFVGTVLADRIGYRWSAVLGNAFSLVGFILLGTLPTVMEGTLLALLIATSVSAVGGGLLEVIVSPIVEALPKEETGFSMNLLHSFYCWGHVAVILVSTLFFSLFSLEYWYVMAFTWGILPLVAGGMLIFVPMRQLTEEKTGASLRYLFGRREFYLLMIVMLAAGASELSMAQWASYFAEEGLGVSKALGDLLGPASFAVAMGATRLVFGVIGDRFKMERCLLLSFLLCIASYLLAALSTSPYVSLLGCAVTGVAVAILWPGTYTLGATLLRRGGTPMFALFALAGDLGCAIGPTIVAAVSDAVTSGKITNPFPDLGTLGGGIRTGLLVAVVFPMLAVISCLLLSLVLPKSRKHGRKTEAECE